MNLNQIERRPPRIARKPHRDFCYPGAPMITMPKEVLSTLQVKIMRLVEADATREEIMDAMGWTSERNFKLSGHFVNIEEKGWTVPEKLKQPLEGK